MSSAVASAASAAAPQTGGQGSPQTSSRDGRGNGQGEGGAGGSADTFDYRSAFSSQSKKLQDTESNLRSLRGELEGKKGDFELLNKLKSVFEPDNKQQAEDDPIPGYENKIDAFLEYAMEAKAKGREMPLTMDIALTLYRSLIEQHKTFAAIKAENAEFKKQMQALQDPRYNINQRAYATFDARLKQGLERIYGASPATEASRVTQFNAISRQIGQAITKLQQENPQRWEQIARDPQAVEAIADRALRQNLPPKALQMLEQEKLRNEPMTEQELWDAFRESKDIKDDNQRRSVRESLRRDILALTMGGQGRARAAG